jgi:Ca2+-dependent lipid-binding protein
MTLDGPAQPTTKFKTCIKNMTVNPEWFESFAMKVYDPEAVLKIQIFDEDYGQAEFMCGVNIPVMSLLSENKRPVSERPLRYRLCTPELQWQSRGEWRISQGKRSG